MGLLFVVEKPKIKAGIKDRIFPIHSKHVFPAITRRAHIYLIFPIDKSCDRRQIDGESGN